MIGFNIKHRREELGLTQEELAFKLGYKSKSTINKIEMGINDIVQSKIVAFATALDTTPSHLMGWIDEEKQRLTKTNAIKIPVLGHVAAGIPIEAIEDIIDYEDISEEMARKGEYFALRIQGDSMEPRIWNNDVVIVRKQEDAENGDLVIAIINGDDATCKRLKKYSGGIMLTSNNPKYEPMYYSEDDIKSIPITIIGRVVELRGKF